MRLAAKPVEVRKPMALESRSILKVGGRVYYPGERLVLEHEQELRGRPAFSLLLDEGHVVEVADDVEEEAVEPAEPERDKPLEPSAAAEAVFKALDAAFGGLDEKKQTAEAVRRQGTKTTTRKR